MDLDLCGTCNGLGEDVMNGHICHTCDGEGTASAVGFTKDKMISKSKMSFNEHSAKKEKELNKIVKKKELDY